MGATRSQEVREIFIKETVKASLSTTQFVDVIVKPFHVILPSLLKRQVWSPIYNHVKRDTEANICFCKSATGKGTTVEDFSAVVPKKVQSHVK